MGTIRAKSLCVFRQGGKILLAEGYDEIKNEHFLRPVGGSIDFAETSEQAAKREVLEELGAEAHAFKLLGVSENIFTFNGEQGHEIVFVYEARFKNEALYQEPIFQCIESNGLGFVAKWFNEAQLSSKKIHVYPCGLVDMLVG
jgi:8-oxo-dGTP pyrophosphatase MutT (NUDIX family)